MQYVKCCISIERLAQQNDIIAYITRCGSSYSRFCLSRSCLASFSPLLLLWREVKCFWGQICAWNPCLTTVAFVWPIPTVYIQVVLKCAANVPRHTEHWKGRMPVCPRMCLLRLFLCVNVFHCKHKNSLCFLRWHDSSQREETLEGTGGTGASGKSVL